MVEHVLLFYSGVNKSAKSTTKTFWLYRHRWCCMHLRESMAAQASRDALWCSAARAIRHSCIQEQQGTPCDQDARIRDLFAVDLPHDYVRPSSRTKLAAYRTGLRAKNRGHPRALLSSTTLMPGRARAQAFLISSCKQEVLA